MRFVIDNSVVMAWAFEDECSPYADEVLSRLVKDEALASSVWPLELLNVLLAAERRKRITEIDSGRFLKLINTLPIEVSPTPSPATYLEILTLGRKMNLSAYDASYLCLAIQHEIPLATQDEELLKAARKCGVKTMK